MREVLLAYCVGFSGHKSTILGRKDAETEVVAVSHEALDVVPTARRADSYNGRL